MIRLALRADGRHSTVTSCAGAIQAVHATRARAAAEPARSITRPRRRSPPGGSNLASREAATFDAALASHRDALVAPMETRPRPTARDADGASAGARVADTVDASET